MIEALNLFIVEIEIHSQTSSSICDWAPASIMTVYVRTILTSFLPHALFATMQLQKILWLNV